MHYDGKVVAIASSSMEVFNALRLRQNGRHFADIFKWIFLNENIWILIKISLNFVPKGRINNIPALVLIMAWRWWGDQPLSEPMMVSLLTHICITWPEWVKDVPLTTSSTSNSHQHDSLFKYQSYWEPYGDAVLRITCLSNDPVMKTLISNYIRNSLPHLCFIFFLPSSLFAI